jgi:hypothetical protein
MLHPLSMEVQQVMLVELLLQYNHWHQAHHLDPSLILLGLDRHLPPPSECQLSLNLCPLFPEHEHQGLQLQGLFNHHFQNQFRWPHLVFTELFHLHG